MSIGKINRKASTLREQAYEIIKSAIMNGKLMPGEPLVEDQLAKDMGLSRTPLREALVLLERDQYIEMIPYKGTFVTNLTEQEVKEIFQIREVLETEAVCWSLSYFTKEEILELREYFAAVRSKVEQGDLEAFLASNKVIHDKLLFHASNETLRNLIVNYIEKIQRYQTMVKAYDNQTLIIDEFSEHCELIEALLCKNVEHIRHLMVSHLQNCCNRILRQMD